VPNVFEIQGTVLLIALLASILVKIFAFVNSLMYSRESYTAANKLTKPAWCAILGVGLLWTLIFPGSPINLVNLVFLIAAFVYLADVRPALAGLTRRR
jgi:hypothetical protein